MSPRIAVLALCLACPPSSAWAGRVFPYRVQKKTLANGLDVVVIETPEFKDVLSYNTMVLAGSRNEMEKGRTGLAHLFEHILFRHRYKGQEGGYDELMSRLGSHNNATTSEEITYYFPLTFSSNLAKGGARGELPGIVELEASRFKALDVPEATFKTEAGAVLGEYRKDASHPDFKMAERLGALMFPHHPYGHTTIGVYEDVVNMPSSYGSAKRFYDDYYRPNNCVVVVVGDVRAKDVFAQAAARYKDWASRPIPKVVASGPAPAQGARDHVSWDADVAPLVWVSHRMPAFKPGSPQAGAEQLLGELLFNPAAPLYKKLRYEKQTASVLGLEEGTGEFESFDPKRMTVSAELYKDKLAARGTAYFDEVAADIVAGLEELKTFSSQPNAAALLSQLKSRYRYDFLAGLSSPGRIASTFAWYYRFDRDLGALDKLLASVERLKPADIDALARAQFTPENRVILTLSYEPKTGGQQTGSAAPGGG